MRRYRRHVTCALLAVFVLQTVYAPRMYANDFFGRYLRFWKETHYHGTPPVVCEDTAVEILAENIDWLEHHIDRYGSVVAKQPDIWGEARLTKHRDEYEKELFKELNQFQERINARITQSDSSFLAQSMALANAAAGAPATVPSAEDATLKKPDGTPISTACIEGADTVELEQVIHLDQLSRYLQHLQELRRINEGDDTSDSPGYSLNLVRIPVSISPGKLTHQGFGAEITLTATPYLSDDLLPTTFRNLVINDLVDQLSLPLVKTVENVELLKERQEIKEAREILTSFSDKVLSWNYIDSEEDRQEVRILVHRLLDNERVVENIQKTVEGLIVNGIEGVDRIALSLQKVALSEELKKHQAWIDQYNATRPRSEITVRPSNDYVADHIAAFALRMVRHRTLNEDNDKAIAEEALANAIIAMGVLDVAEKKAEELRRNGRSAIVAKEQAFALQSISPDAIPQGDLTVVNDEARQVFEEFRLAIERILVDFEAEQNRMASSSVSSSGRARRAVEPLPPSQVIPVYGPGLFYSMADFFCPAYDGRNIRWQGDASCKGGLPVTEAACKGACDPRVDLLDAQKWLRAELAAAHELLSQPYHLQLFYQFARPDSGLAKSIRSGHLTGTGRHTPLIDRASYSEEEHLSFPQRMSDAGPELIMTPFAEEDVANQLEANASVESYRKHFFNQLHANHFAEGNRNPQVLAQLAWAIVVESALLNQHLNTDVRKSLTAKGDFSAYLGDQDLSFFLPEEAAKPEAGLAEEYMMATQLFQDYVRCRWPIHVFALDPREQDQNVADASVRKRELQFALSLAFVTGQIGGRSLTQYSRDLQTEVDTIGLNRTASAFAHGPDTFGWRFYPRVQPLDVPGTLGTLWQSVAGTPRDADVRHRQLEPGMRECTAIVLMPSFVPYVDVDVRSNWFRLTNPKNAVFTMKDAILFSKAITAMRNSQAECARCAECYRPGEVQNLMARVHQLDRELPLQSMRQLVPYENTLGGFEMFNTGITDLAPELVGWYGAPGIVINTAGVNSYMCGCAAGCIHGAPCTDAEKCAELTNAVNTLEGKVNAMTASGAARAVPPPVCEGFGTTVFLVGDNFSVHDTKVIAGGVCIPHVQLVSRQIMRVTIPSCVNTVFVDGQEYVAVYAATPYGITNHLHVPVYCRDAAGGRAPCATCLPCEPTAAEAEAAQPTPATPPADANVLRLIPLPVVEDNYQTVSYLQDEANGEVPTETAIEAINRVRDESLARITSAQPLVMPTQLIVNVPNSEPSRHCSADKAHCGPVAKQMRTRIRECWHNLRDLLPCN